MSNQKSFLYPIILCYFLVRANQKIQITFGVFKHGRNSRAFWVTACALPVLGAKQLRRHLAMSKFKTLDKRQLQKLRRFPRNQSKRLNLVE